MFLLMCLTMACGLLPLLNLTSTAIALFLVLSFDIDLCGDPVLLSLHLHHIETHYRKLSMHDAVYGTRNVLQYGVVYPLLGYDLLALKDQHPRSPLNRGSYLLTIC